MNPRTLFATLIFAGGLAFSGAGFSALVNCPTGFTADGTAKVHDGSASKNTAADLCEYDDSASNQTDSLSLINTLEFFGFNDWLYAGKQNIGGVLEDGTEDIGLSITGDGQSGTWSISMGAFLTYSDIMFIFKDGANTDLTGFLLNGSYTSGGWDTPFVNPPFDVNADRDVSHITAYVREGGGGTPPGQIPEPGVLGLLGIGLVGFGASVFRRRRAAA